MDEIAFGNIDGRNDGGIDGFFIFVNGHLLTDTERFLWPRSGSLLEIWIITCKHHDTFNQSPLDNIVASTTELFDFSLENEHLKGDYSEELLSKRDTFKLAYRKVSPKLAIFKLNFCYASRGNTFEIGESILSRADQLKKIAIDNFGKCSTSFTFLGSTELIELHRKKPKFTLELPFLDYLSSGKTYVLLAKLSDYYHFISDNNKLRRYLFDSNVRDFMGSNRVNEDIKNTLVSEKSPDFCWLNNGVTILSTYALIVGKSIEIQDIQIVNGLQTSESIYRYFHEGGVDIADRSVLVKVVVSNNSEDRDEIIRATNNQTVVELSALHATDKIQRDIEDALKMDDFFYERRTNFYKNQDVSHEKILTPLYVAAGFLNLILKSPEQATNLKSKFMRNKESYERIFNKNTNLKVWHKIALILKLTDQFIETKRSNVRSSSEHFLKNRRHYISFLTISRILNNFNFNENDLIQFEFNKLSSNEFEKSWKLLKDEMPLFFNNTKIKGGSFLLACREMSESENVLGFDRLNKTFTKPTAIYQKKQKILRKEITDEFLSQVEMLLPQQPWKPGMHIDIASKLDCSSEQVFGAVNILIKEEKIKKQKDGVLYDLEGNVVGFDEERVDAKTLKLK